MSYAKKVGTSYEYFVLENIKKEYEQVWHWKDFPEKLMYENNLIKNYDTFCKYRYDIGADLVAFKNNKYYFIQCKNFNETILMECLAGFYFLLYEYNLTGVLYYNGTLSQRVKDLSSGKIEFINLPFNNMTIIEPLINNSIIEREYQIEAYNKLKDKTNCILSLPCGMGKTHIATMLSNNYNNIIILSPLRALALQTLEYFKIQLGITYEPILISVDGKRDIQTIYKYIKQKNIISSTYDSADIVVEIINKLNNVLLIIDEFHNLSENNINNTDNIIYKLIHNECNKLFMSATPIKNFMNITDIYSYNWNDAIKNKYICDFSIFIPDKIETYKTFTEMIKITCSEIHENSFLKEAYYILKNMLYNGDKKCICYMTSIENGENITNIFSWISKLLNIELEYWQIDYSTKKTIRENILKKFRESNKIAILINVHILDEGINIKECDSIFITRPNDNIINIVQRMCRANRITETKSKCNIYLWCSEKKSMNILDYIYENTNGIINNKVYIYNTEITSVKKHIVQKPELIKNISLKESITQYLEKNKIVIDSKFIDTYFVFYDMCNLNKFGIELEKMLDFLDIKERKEFYKRFRNKYILNIDYIIIRKNKQKEKGVKDAIYYISFDIFEKICMSSKAQKAEQVRDYFIKLRKFYITLGLTKE